MAHGARSGGFVAFYRRYTKTWIHALSTAALTIFGILIFVHQGFAAVAVAAYVLPPIVLYLLKTDPSATGSDGEVTTDPDREAGGNGTADTGLVTDADDDPATRTAIGAGSKTETDTDTGNSDSDSDSSSHRVHWTAAESPTDAALFDAVVTDDGAFAVGAEGVVLADEGDGWRVARADGPSASASDLRGAAATADGGAVWVAGDGGALGRLDAETGRHTDFSAPRDVTDNWTDAAVGGPTGDETVLLVNGSGEVLRGRYRDGDLAWDAPTKPGSGSSFSGVALADAAGYLCDTNDGVLETEDGGETFRRIGIEGADGTLTDVATTGPGDCAVSADDGAVHRYENGNWTPIRVDDAALSALARRGERELACGGEGIVYESAGATDDWERIVTPASGTLRGVALGAERAVAVGENGAVVERGHTT